MKKQFTPSSLPLEKSSHIFTTPGSCLDKHALGKIAGETREIRQVGKVGTKDDGI